MAVAAIRDRLAQLAELDDRRAAILRSLEERDLLTDELSAAVAAAETMTALEDVYAPYRPKRRTRATIAREAGLEPLADLIVANQATVHPVDEAAAFVSAERNVPDAEAALAGARDILAERFSDDATARASLRQLYWAHGAVRSARRRRARRTRAPSSRTTSTGPNRSRASRVTACWRFAAARPRGSCACASPRQRMTRCGSSSACSCKRLGRRGRAGPPGCPRRLRAPARARHRKRDPRRIEEEGRRRGDSRVRRQPAPAAARAAARAAERAGDRPGIPHRVQGGLPRPARAAPAPRRDLPDGRLPGAGQGSRRHGPRAGAPLRDRGDRHRQRHGQPRDRAVRAQPRSAALHRHRVRQRERRLHLLGERGGARGVPGPGRDRARRGEHRPAAGGPALRAGEARPEVDRRRPVPARRGPGVAQARPRRRGGVVRERRRRRAEHGEQAAAQLRVGPRAVAGGEDRRASRRAGPVPVAEGPAARAAARAEGVRAVRRVPADSRRRPSARRERRAPGELRDRGPHGA